MLEYAKTKKEYEKYKQLKRRLCLKDAKLLNVKQMKENLNKIHENFLKIIKNKKT